MPVIRTECHHLVHYTCFFSSKYVAETMGYAWVIPLRFATRSVSYKVLSGDQQSQYTTSTKLSVISSETSYTHITMTRLVARKHFTAHSHREGFKRYKGLLSAIDECHKCRSRIRCTKSHGIIRKVLFYPYHVSKQCEYVEMCFLTGGLLPGFGFRAKSKTLICAEYLLLYFYAPITDTYVSFPR
jgi:hypothetical protein